MLLGNYSAPSNFYTTPQIAPISPVLVWAEMHFINNILIKGFNNPIIVKFRFDDDFEKFGLNNFSEVQVKIDDQTYNTDNRVSILNKNILIVDVGSVIDVEPGEYIMTVIGLNTRYPQGYKLNSAENHNLPLLTIR